MAGVTMMGVGQLLGAMKVVADIVLAYAVVISIEEAYPTGDVLICLEGL
jgi:hypothetical protein